MNTLNILQGNRAEILALAARHGASNVRLFDLFGLQQDIEKAIGINRNPKDRILRLARPSLGGVLCLSAFPN